MADASDGRVLDTGDIIKSDKGSFEVTAVSRHEHDPEHLYFVYQVRETEELEANRQLEADREAAAVQAQKEAEAAQQAEEERVAKLGQEVGDPSAS